MWNGIIRIIPSKFVLTMTHNHIYPKKFFYVTSDGGGCLDKRKLNLVNPSKSFNLLLFLLTLQRVMRGVNFSIFNDFLMLVECALLFVCFYVIFLLLPRFLCIACTL